MNLLSAALAIGLCVGVGSPAARADGGGGGSAATAAGGAGAPLPVARARLDDLYRRRDEPRRGTKSSASCRRCSRARPTTTSVLWRAARFYFWASDDPGLAHDHRSRWGKDGWDLGRAGGAVNPNDVAGHYWAAAAWATTRSGWAW